MYRHLDVIGGGAVPLPDRGARGSGSGGSGKLAKLEECVSPAVLGLSLLSATLAILYLFCVLTPKVDFRVEELPLMQWKDNGSAVLASSSASTSQTDGDEPHSLQFRQHEFRPHGLQSFVQYSAYRVSADSFVVLGLGARKLEGIRTVENCSWWPRHDGERGDGEHGVDADGSLAGAVVVAGKVEVTENTEHHYWTYSVLLLKCSLEGKAVADKGGDLFVHLDGRDVCMFSEEPDASRLAPDGSAPYLHNVTHCSPPIHGEVYADRIVQWVRYHWDIGIDFFLMFDVGGIRQEMKRMLMPFLRTGIVQITDFRDIAEYKVWYFGQLLITNDCLYRFRFSTRWLMFLDFDEYMALKPLETLRDILPRYEGASYISHGCLWWDLLQCLPPPENDEPDERWPVERMLWHWPKWYCMNETKYSEDAMCLDYEGHRKLIIDPRQVYALENHRTQEPREGGVDLNAADLHHDHFHGLIHKGVKECNTTRTADEVVTWWAHGPEQATRARQVRLKPIPFAAILPQRQWWEEFVRRSHAKSAR